MGLHDYILMLILEW